MRELGDRRTKNGTSATSQDVRHLSEADQLWMLQQEVAVMKGAMFGWPAEQLIEDCVDRSVYEEHIARYSFSVPYVRGEHLDMACGSGYGSAYLAKEASVKRVTGVDINPDVARYAALRYGSETIHFECQNACEAWTDATFDSITSFETIEHVPAPDRMLTQIVRMLRPDGTLIVSTPVRLSGALKDEPQWPYHVREWTFEEFRALLSEFFDVLIPAGQIWEIRQKYGPLGVTQDTVRKWMRRSGFKDDAVERLKFDMVELKRLPLRFLEPSPRYCAFICKKPHQPKDERRLRQLAYGEK